MRIKAIRFEPGTITPSMKRLDVVHAEHAFLMENTIGVLVDDDFIPWHRVQSIRYERTERIDRVSLRAPHDIAELRDLPGKVVDVTREIVAVDRTKGSVTLGERRDFGGGIYAENAKATKPPKRK